MPKAQGGCYRPKVTFSSRGAIWRGAGGLGRPGVEGAGLIRGFGKWRRDLERWVGGQGRDKHHSLWSLAHLLIQAELREGQKQHQTKRGPANQGRSGDIGWKPQLVLRHSPSPQQAPHILMQISQKAEVTSSLPPPPLPVFFPSLPGTQPFLHPRGTLLFLPACPLLHHSSSMGKGGGDRK